MGAQTGDCCVDQQASAKLTEPLWLLERVALHKRKYLEVIKDNFCLFCKFCIEHYVETSLHNCLNETVQIRGHNIFSKLPGLGSSDGWRAGSKLLIRIRKGTACTQQRGKKLTGS